MPRNKCYDLHFIIVQKIAPVAYLYKKKNEMTSEYFGESYTPYIIFLPEFFIPLTKIYSGQVCPGA